MTFSVAETVNGEPGSNQGLSVSEVWTVLKVEAHLPRFIQKVFREQWKQATMTPCIITLAAVGSFTSVDLQTHSLLSVQL